MENVIKLGKKHTHLFFSLSLTMYFSCVTTMEKKCRKFFLETNLIKFNTGEKSEG
jgi:hypothetical protein